MNNIEALLKKKTYQLLNLFRDNPVEPQIENQIKLGFQKALKDSGNTIVDHVVSSIKKDGFIIINSVFNEDIMLEYNKEFNHIISQYKHLPYRTDLFKNATCVRVKPTNSLPINKFPYLSSFCRSSFFLKIAQEYFNSDSQKLSFNQEMFVHETPESEQTLSSKMHWDIHRMLKFWLFIDDVNIESGAMSLIKGSIDENNKKRESFSQANKIPIKTKDNIVEDDINNQIFCSGKKGSILIFDTECSHASNPVLKDHTRKIIRAHTYIK